MRLGLNSCSRRLQNRTKLVRKRFMIQTWQYVKSQLIVKRFQYRRCLKAKRRSFHTVTSPYMAISSCQSDPNF
ncbi:hypothetical protein L596_017598 [Steinernema carpocapsae]|uniref:Uncharacterized protein n=1 Tax=Steinernema carpocapsae TaxID=34508 RepID=A0A4U5N2G0_STECR|nr:hypothetical protein L596_017598 [Steinernema carpocapsae]